MSVLIAINLGISGYIFYNVMHLERSVERVDTVQSARNAVLAFNSSVLDAHKNFSEFINSGDLYKRERYKEIWEKLEGIENELYEIVAAIDKSFLPELEQLYSNLNQWEEEIAAKQLSYMLSPLSVDLARLYEASEENAQIWSGINQNIQHVIAFLDREMADKTAQQHALMKMTSLAVIIGSAMIFIGAVLTSIFLVQTISKPLSELVSVTSRLIDKDWGVHITGVEREDEIGQMANALLLFRDSGKENERLQELQKQEDAKRLERAQRIEALVAQFREDSMQTTAALEQATVDMKRASESMTHIAAETSNLSSRVAQAANETGMNVQSVSAATEELTASINEISRQLNHTNHQAQSAQGVAQSAVEKMKLLENSVGSIGNVIQIISDIAEQTNLLALNATIESARAGEAGKGFAVVAHEVKNLANETASATDQVRVQIENMQQQTNDAVSMIEDIFNAIDELTASSGSIAAAMEEQTSATKEISRNVSEAAVGTDTVAESISHVNAATEETGDTASKVAGVSDELSARSHKLKDSIKVFIESIKAA